MLLSEQQALLFGKPVPQPELAQQLQCPRPGPSRFANRQQCFSQAQLVQLGGRRLQLTAVRTSGQAPSPGSQLIGCLGSKVYVLQRGGHSWQGGQYVQQPSAMHVLDTASWRWQASPVELPAEGLPCSSETSTAAVAGCLYLFSSGFSREGSWVHCFDPARRPLRLEPVQVAGPQPTVSSSTGAQRHLAAAVLGDGRVLLLHSSLRSFLFDAGAGTVAEGPRLELPAGERRARGARWVAF